MTTPYDQGPVAALRRVAFLMERRREETRRVQAFRNAAATILPLPDDEVADRVEAGTLTDLPGIGPSTAAVIEAATRGELPDRLAKLEREIAGPLTVGGKDLRAAPPWRPALPLRLVRRRLADRGDGDDRDGARARVPRADRPLAAAHGRQRASAARLTKQLGVVDAVNRHLAGAGFTLLKGIEVDILDDGGARPVRRDAGSARRARGQRALQAEDGARRDDASDDRSGPQPAHQRARPLHRSLGDGQPGHPARQQVRRAGGLRGLRRARRRGRDQLAPRAPRPADGAARAGPRPRLPASRSTPTAHAPGQLDFLDYGCERAEAAGIEADRIVNTWPRDAVAGLGCR